MAKISEFRQKEVVDIHTGKKLGYVCDIELDCESGKIISITVPSGKIFSSMIKHCDKIIPWDRIKKIGGDIILVDCENAE